MGFVDLADVWLLLLVLLSGGLALDGLSRRAGYLKLPCLASMFYLAWVAPQLIALRGDWRIPPDGYAKLTLMAVLCLLALWLGWRLAGSALRCKRPVNVERVQDMVMPVALLTAFSLLIEILIAREKHAGDLGTQWSGPVTIMAFFGQLRIVPLLLSLTMFLRRRTWATTVLVVVNMGITVPVAVIALRRSEMVDVALVALLALWFSRRMTVPLPVLGAGGVVLTLIVFSIGAIRGATNSEAESTGRRLGLLSPSVISSASERGDLMQSLANAPDLRNAAHLISVVETTESFTWGAATWNQFVHQYVPGQLVGYDVKRSLMSEITDVRMANIDYRTGTTSTGFGSAYQEAGFLAAVIFGLIGFLMRGLWGRAMAGDVWMQALYACTLGLVLISFTHSHNRFFTQGLPMLAAVLGARVLARLKAGKRQIRLRSGERAGLGRSLPIQPSAIGPVRR